MIKTILVATDGPGHARKGRPSTWQLVAAAKDLAAAAKANDAPAVKTAFRALGKTCGGCHKQFRIKKK
jgi:cytochrome c556